MISQKTSFTMYFRFFFFIQMENAASKCIRVCEPIQTETYTQPEEVNFAYSIAVHFQNGCHDKCVTRTLREVCHDSRDSTNDSCLDSQLSHRKRAHRQTTHTRIYKKTLRISNR